MSNFCYYALLTSQNWGRKWVDVVEKLQKFANKLILVVFIQKHQKKTPSNNATQKKIGGGRFVPPRDWVVTKYPVMSRVKKYIQSN